MGEHLPFQLWRIDHRLDFAQKAMGLPAKRTLRDTIKTVTMPSQSLSTVQHEVANNEQNISITTSGHYGTPALLYAVKELGIDRQVKLIDLNA